MFLENYTYHVDNLSVLFFESLRMVGALIKMLPNFAEELFQSLYLVRIRQLEELLAALAFLHPDENVARTEPLTDPEQFDFSPKDLDNPDDTHSSCETLTANFEESLRSFFQSIYQASFGIKDLLKKTYGEWMTVLPVIQDRIEG